MDACSDDPTCFDVMERGDVFFLFQPRVDVPFPDSFEDVQRTLLLMKPDAGDSWRRIVVGHKRLPRFAFRGRRERYWSLVDRSGPLPRVLEGLEPRAYETATRGERFQPGARLVANGRYALTHHQDHVHFAYELAPSAQVGALHESLGIRREANYLLLAMRPRAGGRGSLAWEALPDEVRARFGTRRFCPPTSGMLDHSGMNLVLVPVGVDVLRELEGDRRHDGAPASSSSEELEAAVERFRLQLSHDAA